MSAEAKANRHGQLEEAYLRLFKAAVVALMSLALLAALVLIPVAIYQFTQSPKPVAPAQAANVKAIATEELVKFLVEEERKRQEQERRAKELGAAAANAVPASQTTTVLKYMNEANNLMACADEYRRLVDMAGVPLNQTQMLEALNELRALVERLSTDPTRGDAWVSAMVPFVCQLLKDPAFAQMRKDGKVGQVFYPSIRFHASAWTREANERARFEQAEAQRVQNELGQEDARVAAAHAQAGIAVIAIGAAFAAFMFMALYLIFARIERNLAGIERGVEAEHPPSAAGI